HLEPAVIGAQGDLLFSRGASSTHSLTLDAAFANEILGQWCEYRGLVHSQSVAGIRASNLKLGDYAFAALVDKTHMTFRPDERSENALVKEALLRRAAFTCARLTTVRYFNTLRRNRPVCEALHSTIAGGGPTATTWPPSSP